MDATSDDIKQAPCPEFLLLGIVPRRPTVPCDRTDDRIKQFIAELRNKMEHDHAY